jgi:hypothetical protein
VPLRHGEMPAEIEDGHRPDLAALAFGPH